MDNEMFTHKDAFIMKLSELEIECYPSGAVILNYIEGTRKLVDMTDMSRYKRVRVVASREFVDDLTEIVKYEYRNRLYLADLYIELGFDEIGALEMFGCNYYWELGPDGRITHSKFI